MIDVRDYPQIVLGIVSSCQLHVEIDESYYNSRSIGRLLAGRQSFSEYKVGFCSNAVQVIQRVLGKPEICIPNRFPRDTEARGHRIAGRSQLLELG